MASKRRLFKIQSQNSFDDCLVLGNHRRPAQPHSLPCKYYIVILTSYQIQFQMCTVLLALKLVIWFYSDKFTKRRVYTVLLAWPLFLITSSKLEAGARAFGLSKSKSRFLWSCLQEHQDSRSSLQPIIWSSLFCTSVTFEKMHRDFVKTILGQRLHFSYRIKILY